MSARQYTLRPDSTDERDRIYKLSRPVSSSTLPSKVDLRPYLSPVVDQGSLGSCTSNAIVSGLREYQLIKDDKPLIRLSRLFHYWHEREMEGTINIDSGATIRSGMKVLQQIGCSPEVDFPYVESRFIEKPSELAEQRAGAYKIAEYHRVTTYDDLLVALANGQPVVLGISVYSSFESPDVANRGMVPIPDPAKESLLGGHAVLACGYMTLNDGVQYILVRNSWGKDWGQQGYCWIPKGFFANYVFDMWTGTAEIDPEKMTFSDAIDVLVGEKIFNSPDFWKDFEAKYKAGQLTNDDFQYVFLGYQKFAAYLMNN